MDDVSNLDLKQGLDGIAKVQHLSFPLAGALGTQSPSSELVHLLITAKFDHLEEKGEMPKKEEQDKVPEIRPVAGYYERAYIKLAGEFID